MVLARALQSKAVAVAVLILLAACERDVAQAPPPTMAPPPESVAALFDKLSAVQPPAQGSRAKALVDAVAAPVAQSPQIELPLQRVQGEEVDITSLLPAADAEEPLIWNGWYVDRTIDAFRRAIDENKPLVLVVSEFSCKYCVNLVQDSLRCPSVDRFAGDAVFAIASPTRDRMVAAIASSLNVEGYPTITVLEPEARMLLERGRVNGYFDSVKLGEHLATILWNTPKRLYEDQPRLDGAQNDVVEERRPPPNILRTWVNPPDPAERLAAARSGAARLGLKHASPAPNCL